VSEFPHPARPDAPHSGVLRTIYFLAVAAVAFFLVLTALLAFYDPPEGQPLDFTPGFEDSGGQQTEDDRVDYNRNVTLILTAVSAAVFAAAILGLGSRFHPLRAGLVLGGLIIFLVAMGFWATSSDQWIGFLTTLINFGVLAGCYLFLEEGLPLSAGEPPRRMAPSDIAPPSTPPSTPLSSTAPPQTPPPPSAPPPSAPPQTLPATDFEPSAPPPPPTPEPPPARTEPPPPMSDLPRE